LYIFSINLQFKKIKLLPATSIIVESCPPFLNEPVKKQKKQEITTINVTISC